MTIQLCFSQNAREAVSGSKLSAQKSAKLADFLPHFGSQNSKSLVLGEGPDPELSHKTTFVIWRGEKG